MYNVISSDQDMYQAKRTRSSKLSLSSLSLCVLVTIVLLTALVDLPAGWPLGPISGLAVLTILITSLTWLLWLLAPLAPKSAWSVAKPFVAFLLWAAVSAIWYPPTKLGAQNLVVIMGFVGLILLTARAGSHSFQNIHRIGRILSWSIGIAAALYMFGLANIRLELGIPVFIGPRSFPLFALITLAWHLAAWRYGSRISFWIALGIVGLILTALARTALVVALGMFALAQLQSGMRVRWLRFIALGLLIFGILYALIFYYEPLRSRFFEYDNSFQIGGTAINVMGRGKMWSATWESFKESPWIGNGSGSAAIATSVAVPGMNHPHNDYLRVLHDYGLVGFTLWIFGTGQMLWMTWKAWRRTDSRKAPEVQLHLAAFLGLVAVILTMITDNTLSYAFAMFPLGILLGCSLATNKRLFLPAPARRHRE